MISNFTLLTYLKSTNCIDCFMTAAVLPSHQPLHMMQASWFSREHIMAAMLSSFSFSPFFVFFCSFVLSTVNWMALTAGFVRR